jgi:hypothetical protein
MALFLIITTVIVAFELGVSTEYGGLGTCGGSISYSVIPDFHPSFYIASSPLFSVPQLVVLPGSVTTINMTYQGYDLPTQLNLNNEYYGAGGNYTELDYSLGFFAQQQQTLPSSTGVIITHGQVVYHSNSSASQVFTIKVASDAPWTTYPVGRVGCGSDQGGFLLTVGYLPYWQTIFWVFYWSEIAGALLVSALVVLLAATGEYLLRRSSKRTRTNLADQ